MSIWTDMLAATSGLRARGRRAFKASLLMYAVNSLCAAALVIPVTASVPEQALAESPAVGVLYTAVRVFDVFMQAPLRLAGIPAFALLVVTPFLQIVWLRAQLRPGALHEHARRAADLYRPACLVYLLCAVYAALLANGAFFSARCVGQWLSGTHDLRLQQSVGVLCALPFALAALVHAPSLADRLQLGLAQGETLSRELFRDAVRCVDLRVCAMRAGFVLAGAMLVLASFAPRLWLGTSPSSSASMFVIAQLTAAGRTLLRAIWLAWLCEHVASTAPAPHAGDIQRSGEGTITAA